MEKRRKREGEREQDTDRQIYIYTDIDRGEMDRKIVTKITKTIERGRLRERQGDSERCNIVI